MPKGKPKSSKELAKSISKFLEDKEINEDSKKRFERAVKKAVKPDSK